ncbi:metallophosphoesterase [Bacillus sp. TH22]|uniref:LamG-like jellyroll fold domain-containing protein n=1 Tax=unclassified Bacillus (in: firmicutes) TaxID=185979 RepID=UPI001914629F|nr:MULTISPECIES: FN3 and LamG domain-containing metallophosphoesterase family protein [unclassified Bacillus (in: firmicutes)]MBK5360888.1 metallophosphoesterase [Bacillus sp. TH44]MBK5347425.1 metallophosphoesterase [Bacillus sp. TH45]MBK5365672.1 metallophosphoesterase [Bacillus sp. TH50]MBK5449243.1 metallophosphoesterase [Bacillus sp. TH22]MBK5456825.1 metallophosphoesterase [Bacillus sp. TH23]
MDRTVLRKVKGLIGVLMVFVLAFVSFPWSTSVKAEEKKQEKAPSEKKIVFPVVSDVHIKDNKTDDMFRWKRAIEQLNSIAPKQDAFVIVGDFTDSGSLQQYDRFMQVYNDNANKDAVRMNSLGNHDYWNGLSVEGAQKRFLEKTGMESIYYHKVVKGYHFLVMSPENGATHGYYSDKQINWLKEEMAKAQKDDPEKPIFVFLHQHIKDTVYGSQEWGTQDSAKINAVLTEYPQVITFSGHSHYPLDDPRSIHQKDFTSVGTSSVSYMEVEGGKVQGNIPSESRALSQGLLVEVDDKEVTINRRDFHTNSWTGEPWKIQLPSKKETFTHVEDRDKEKPSFVKDAKLSVSNVTENAATVTFPQAVDNLLVHSYRVQAKDKQTGEIKNKLLAFSEFYRDPVPKELTFTLAGLDGGKSYTLEVVAIDSFGNESAQPLTTEITTKKDNIDPNVKVPKADVFDVNFLDGTFKDNSPFGTKGDVKGNVSVEYDKALKTNVMKLNGKANTFGYLPFSAAQKEKVANSFTLETVFSMNEIRGQGILQNTESGGIGFESTGSGYVELWAHIGGSYKRVGVQLEANKTYHLTGTYNGSEVAIYVDGKKVNSQPASGKVYHPNVPFALGADPDSNGNGGIPLNGQIALAKLYSKALSSSEVVAAYNEFSNRTKLEQVNTLYEEIGKVKEVLAGTYEFGEKPGQYSQAAFNELQRSYDNAKKVFENIASTGEQIVQTYNELKTANQTFLQSKVAEEQPKTPKEKLQINIELAKALVKKAQSANVTEGSVKSLSRKITVAEAVLKDVKVKDAQVEKMNRTIEHAISLVEKSMNK